MIVIQWIREMGCALLSLHSSNSGLNPVFVHKAMDFWVLKNRGNL